MLQKFMFSKNTKISTVLGLFLVAFFAISCNQSQHKDDEKN